MLSAGAVVGLAGETGVPVPNLAGGPGYGTVLALLAPAPTVAILAGGLAGRRLPGELAAARLVRLLDLVWVVIGVAWFALAATATDLAGTRDAAVRNLVGFAGLMLLADRYLPYGSAAAVTTAYALVGTTLGQARDPAWWAWFLRPAADRTALLIAVVAAVVGLTALTGRPRTPRHN
jgi:hypothetical protein